MALMQRQWEKAIIDVFWYKHKNPGISFRECDRYSYCVISGNSDIHLGKYDKMKKVGYIYNMPLLTSVFDMF